MVICLIQSYGIINRLSFLFFFACAIGLLGKSIVSVRIAGTLCVASTAYLIYLTGRKIQGYHTGIIAASLSILFLSFSDSGQAALSEHIATVPMVGALYLFIARGSNPRNLFIIGTLMAVASFVRLNLAYVAMIVGTFLVAGIYATQHGSVLRSIKCGLAYAVGGCLILILTCLPYLLTGNQELWWNSAILAPLSYSTAQLSFLGAFSKQIYYVGPFILIWFSFFAGITVVIMHWRTTSGADKYGSILVLVFFFSVEISILSSGAYWGHYLNQLFPFMALLLAMSLTSWHSFNSHRITNVILFLVLVISVVVVTPDYKDIIFRIFSGQSLKHDITDEIAVYLQKENTAGEPVYIMTEDHIIYWLNGLKPLRKSVTHPSNISRDYLLRYIVGPGTNTETEMFNVLAQEPRFILTKKDVSYLRDKSSARSLLDNTLSMRYTLVKQIDDRLIYRRNQ